MSSSETWCVTMSRYAIVVAGILISHMLRAVRLAMCYRRLDRRLREITGIAFIHNSLNFWLPMRLGELALPLLSRFSLNLPVVDSTLTLIFIRLMDIHVLLLLVFYFAGPAVFEGIYFWLTLLCFPFPPSALKAMV